MTPETKRLLRARRFKLIRWSIKRELPRIIDAIVLVFYIAITCFLILQIANHKKVQTTLPLVNTTNFEPFKAASVSAVVKPLTDEEMIKSLPHGKLVWQIYGHESTWGKHDPCREKGQFNGFGYGWDGSHYPCFDSLKDVATKVSNWLDKRLETMTINQALCYYNQGAPNGKLADECEYERYTQSL